jgi:AraC-like DNA-binding protein
MNEPVSYVLRPPDPRVRGLLKRDYLAFTQQATVHDRWLATPTTTVTLILNLGHAFGGLPPMFVAGPTDTHGVVDQAGAIDLLELKLTPLGAYTLLGTPMTELTNQVIDLAEVLPPTRELRDRLSDAPSLRHRCDLLDTFLLDRADRGPRPADEVTQAFHRLTETHGTIPVGALADEVGWSRRHLVSRFHQQIGLPPKTLARILRFERLLSRLRPAAPAHWTRLAAECGYYDQAHLNRDFREFTGITPTGYLARLMPAGPEITSVQYTWVTAA